jgi:DNA-binding NarL/FixJ family response regulator
MDRTPRVLVADASVPTRVGLGRTLLAGGFEIAGEADEAESAVRIALSERPDVAILSIDLPGGGVDAARRIAAGLPSAKIVIMSERPTGEELLAAVRSGATGYLGKDVSGARLSHVVNAVLAGEVALPRRHTQHLLEELRGRDIRRTLLAARTGARLTGREWEVLELLSESASTAEIALRLGISDVTVRRHVASLLSKLGVKDRASAAKMIRGPSIE